MSHNCFETLLFSFVLKVTLEFFSSSFFLFFSSRYLCMNFALPSDQKYHLIARSAVMLSPHVHHMILYGCTSLVNVTLPQYTCFFMLSQCQAPLVAWAPVSFLYSGEGVLLFFVPTLLPRFSFVLFFLGLRSIPLPR